MRDSEVEEKPVEGPEQTAETPDQKPEILEYNEAGLEKLGTQANAQIEVTSTATIGKADQRAANAATALGIDQGTAETIMERGGFGQRMEDAKSGIADLAKETKAKIKTLHSGESTPAATDGTEPPKTAALPDQVHPGVTSETTSKKGVELKQNFGYLLQERDIHNIVREKLIPEIKNLLKFNPEKINLYEATYQKILTVWDLRTLEDDDRWEFMATYYNLREGGITKAEIEDLKRQGDEALEKYFISSVKKERQTISDALEQPSVQEKLAAEMVALNLLFQRTGIQPTKPMPLSQFVGKYEKMLIQLQVGLAATRADAPLGFYHPGANVAMIFKPLPGESFEITDQDIRNMGHENWHGLSPNSENQLCSDAKKLTSVADSAQFKLGFESANPKNKRRKQSLTGLNEGSTELLNRITGDSAGLEPSQPHPYDALVQNTIALLQSLEGQDININIKYQDIPIENVRNLLKKFISRHGTLALAREMRDKIGPDSLAMLDLLSPRPEPEFAKFLALTKNPGTKETITVYPDELQTYGLKFDNLQKRYPFLTLEERKEIKYKDQTARTE